MSGEMILAMCPCPDSQVAIPREQMIALSHARIDNIPDFTFDEELLLELDAWEEDEDNEPDLDKARGVARAALHSELDRLFRAPSDVAIITIEGRSYWVTGGLSWGDAPTDCYSILNVMNQLGVFDTPLIVQTLNEEPVVEVRPVTEHKAIIDIDELHEWRRLLNAGITDPSEHIALLKAITGAIHTNGGSIPDDIEVAPYEPILAVKLEEPPILS